MGGLVMITMKPKELIREIETNYRKWTPYIQRLERLAEKHPNITVALSVGGGDCEADGIIAPITPEGDIDQSKSRPIHEGDPMPQEPVVFTPGR